METFSKRRKIYPNAGKSECSEMQWSDLYRSVSLEIALRSSKVFHCNLLIIEETLLLPQEKLLSLSEVV